VGGWISTPAGVRRANNGVTLRAQQQICVFPGLSRRQGAKARIAGRQVGKACRDSCPESASPLAEPGRFPTWWPEIRFCDPSCSGDR
jgi:hypothetical protein